MIFREKKKTIDILHLFDEYIYVHIIFKFLRIKKCCYIINAITITLMWKTPTDLI